MKPFIVSTHDENRTAPIAVDTMEQDGRSTINRETLEQIGTRYPNLKVMDFEEFDSLRYQALKSPPEAITGQDFINALEVLPPLNWHREASSESFKMAELYSGDLTGIYCRIGEKFFYLVDRFSLPHAEIVRMCQEA